MDNNLFIPTIEVGDPLYLTKDQEQTLANTKSASGNSVLDEMLDALLADL